MTIEERRAKQREYYARNREKIRERNRKRYKKMGKRKKAALNEKKRQWDREHREERLAKDRAKYCTEEYRAKRRVAYAAKHANDPMTEHRRKCIEAAQKRTKTPLEDRKARILADKVKEAALKDMKESGFIQSEDESERNRETVVKYIRQWTKRKVFTAQDLRDGDRMAEADVVAYHKEACKYFEIQERLSKIDPKDYTTRNVLGYKLRVIEEHFNTLLNQRLQTKNRLKSE